MSALYTKYNCFAGDVANKLHDFLGTAGSGADTFKVALTNTAPNVATHTVLVDITEIASGNGYTSGGASAGNVGVNTTGTVTVTGTNPVFTASGGTIGPFRFAVLYNATATGGPLIAYWDYASSVTLNDAETFSVRFNSGVASGTVFSLS